VLRITETCKHGELLQLFCKMWCKIRGLAEHVHNHILDYVIVHKYQRKIIRHINTLRTGDANLRFLRFCITTVKDEWRKSAFLTRAWFPRTSLHNIWSVSPNGPPGRMFKETWPHSELMIYDKYRRKKYPSSVC
jgi:hypothetical protein